MSFESLRFHKERNTGNRLQCSFTTISVFVVYYNTFYYMYHEYVGKNISYSLYDLPFFLLSVHNLYFFFQCYLAAWSVGKEAAEIADYSCSLVVLRPSGAELTDFLFQFSTDKEIFMTVMGGFAIKKLFFMVYFATVVSYILLLDIQSAISSASNK